MRIRLLLLGSALSIAWPVHGQVVRGTVREAGSNAPVPGVIVTLRRVVDSTRALADQEHSVLTNDRGDYSVRGVGAGLYRVTAKRVGFTRQDSPMLSLGEGASERWDVALTAIDVALALPTVQVMADAPCAIRRAEGERVALLWDDARAALLATQLSLRDRLFEATVTRYVRRLAPATFRVLKQEESVRRGVTERAFVSIAPDSLSRYGYVRRDTDGGLLFFAPDAEVLTSAPFLRDHCFSLTPLSAERAGQVGLSFEPIRRVRNPDVRGTLWMDARNHELREVVFSYVQIPELVTTRTEAGGEVKFGRLTNGAWHVSRWFIRLPGFRPATPKPGTLFNTGLEVAHFTEEGGHVTPLGKADVRRSATIVGRLMDSTGARGIRDGVLRLAGTPYVIRSMPDGAFRLDSVPAGRYTIEAGTADYDAFGMLAAEQELDVGEGQRVTTTLAARRTDQILRKLCDTEWLKEDRAALRILVRDSLDRPVPNAAVHARYNVFDIPNTTSRSVVTRPQLFEAEADSLGAVMLCDLPARQRVRVELPPVSGRAVVRDSVTLKPGSVNALKIRP